MNEKEAFAWAKGERSMINVVTQDPMDTWVVRTAEEDAACMKHAYYVLKAAALRGVRTEPAERGEGGGGGAVELVGAGAEAGLVGSGLLEGSRVLPMVDAATGGDLEAFGVPGHRGLAKTMLAMWREEQPVDMVTVLSRLEMDGRAGVHFAETLQLVEGLPELRGGARAAFPWRASSGPSTRVEARMVRTSA